MYYKAKGWKRNFLRKFSKKREGDRRPSSLEEYECSSEDDIVSKGQAYGKQMTVILEEMDPSQLGETFKERFKSGAPLNRSSSSAEMDFSIHDDED